MLEKANVRLNDAAIQVFEWFRKKGFRTCILKGQGLACLPLALLFLRMRCMVSLC
ncbi:MAG: hypothetical protein V8T23_04030 [Prevotella sp.]